MRVNPLGKKQRLGIALTFFAAMFAVMLFVNPMIDGHDGTGVLKLQIAFDKARAVEIVVGWGADGPGRFSRLIVWDYLYAISYSWCMATCLSLMAVKNGLERKRFYRSLVCLALGAGGLDWVENTMELFFVSSPSDYPESLFVMHSMVAVTKWGIIAFVLAVLLFLLQKQLRKGITSSNPNLSRM